MKSFKQFLLEMEDPARLPPPTVVYPDSMENPPDEALQPAKPLPPDIDWKGMDILINLWRKLKEFYDTYGHLDPETLRLLAQLYGIKIGTFINRFNINSYNFFHETLPQLLKDYFKEKYPDATHEQIMRFHEHLSPYFSHPPGAQPAESDTDWDPSRTPRNQPKPKPNLPKKPFWPGHADGVVG